MTTRFILAICWLAAFLQFTRTVPASQVLVVGQDSDNVVQFDLTTGAWKEFVHLPAQSHPRGIAISESGDVFIGLEGLRKNIVKIGHDLTFEVRDLTRPPVPTGP